MRTAREKTQWVARASRGGIRGRERLEGGPGGATKGTYRFLESREGELATAVDADAAEAATDATAMAALAAVGAFTFEELFFNFFLSPP